MEKLTYHLITGHTLEVVIESDELLTGTYSKKLNIYFCGMSVKFDMIRSLMRRKDADDLCQKIANIELYNDISARAFAN